MVFFPWKEEYKIGIEEIDSQHKGLISLINKLYQAMREGKGRYIVHEILKNLIEYTEKHFKTEEGWMEEYKYPGLQRHREEHESLKRKVQEMEENFMDAPPGFSIKLANFLKEWLHNHLLGSDKRFGDFLKKDEDRDSTD